MCQMSRPSPGMYESYPVFSLFSTRKHSPPPESFIGSLNAAGLPSPSGMSNRYRGAVISVGTIQPSLILPHAPMWAGDDPFAVTGPAHEPVAIRSHMPAPGPPVAVL